MGELDAGRAGEAVTLLEAAQAHAAAAEKAGRAYDRTDPPTSMAAHEYYDKALRAAIDGPLGKVHFHIMLHLQYHATLDGRLPVPSSFTVRNSTPLTIAVFGNTLLLMDLPPSSKQALACCW